MSVENDIMTAIVNTMKGNSAFNDIVAFFIGTPDTVNSQHFPNAVIVPVAANIADGYTGNRAIVEYAFGLGFFEQVPDNYTLTARVATVASYQEVLGYAAAARTLFHAIANRDLGSLSGSNYVVSFLELSQVDYGFIQPDERTNNYENYAAITLTVRVTETY